VAQAKIHKEQRIEKSRACPRNPVPVLVFRRTSKARDIGTFGRDYDRRLEIFQENFYYPQVVLESRLLFPAHRRGEGSFLTNDDLCGFDLVLFRAAAATRFARSIICDVSRRRRARAARDREREKEAINIKRGIFAARSYLH